MSDPAALIITWLVGLGLGTMFFGGLWWTLRKAVASERPAFWFACSSLARTMVVLSGFYFVSAGQWQRLLLCLLGFVMARAGVFRLTRPSVAGSHPTREARHES